jgi:hypothetical protein
VKNLEGIFADPEVGIVDRKEREGDKRRREDLWRRERVRA